MTSQTREKIAGIIRALLAKTTANGATEAEAMLAAEKARELMDRYHLDNGAVGMEAEGTAKATSAKSDYKTLIIKHRIAASIGKFCDCKVWLANGATHYFGLRADAEFAVWLTDTLEAFVKRQVLAYVFTTKAMPPKARWEHEKAFVLGACYRIHERLTALAKSRSADCAKAATPGQNLVVVKSRIVDREFATLGLKLGASRRSSTRANNSGAYAAGRAAGDRASFGRPVNAGARVGLLA